GCSDLLRARAHDAAGRSVCQQGRENARMGSGLAEEMAYSGISIRGEKTQYVDGGRKQQRAAGFPRLGAGDRGRSHGRSKSGSSWSLAARSGTCGRGNLLEIGGARSLLLAMGDGGSERRVSETV